LNENNIAFNIKKLILGDTIQFSLSFSYWIKKFKNLTKVPPQKKNILKMAKTPLISKYSIILHEKQHSYGDKNILFIEFLNNKQQETSTIACDV